MINTTNIFFLPTYFIFSLFNVSLPKQNIFITVIRRLGVGWTRVSHTMNVETRRQLAKVDAPSTMYVLGIELRSRAWRQARLPAEPPCWPTEYFYSYLTNFFFSIHHLTYGT